MSDITTIPLQEAAKKLFAHSTSAELRSYLTELGEEFTENESQDKLRARVLAAMGLTSISGETRREVPAGTRVVTKGEAVRPPYNLTPNGLWGGRRRRIRLPRPEGAKLAKSEPIIWNGKATYWLQYDEVVDVPYPIYHVLMDRRRRVPSPKKITHEDGTTEMTTQWEFFAMPITDLGDDPVTASRAGSMTEWYQWQGPEFFERRNTRELQTICSLLDISPVKTDVNKTSKSDEEMRSEILIFLYGDANVRSANADKAEPETA